MTVRDQLQPKPLLRRSDRRMNELTGLCRLWWNWLYPLPF